MPIRFTGNAFTVKLAEPLLPENAESPANTARTAPVYVAAFSPVRSTLAIVADPDASVVTEPTLFPFNMNARVLLATPDVPEVNLAERLVDPPYVPDAEDTVTVVFATAGARVKSAPVITALFVTFSRVIVWDRNPLFDAVNFRGTGPFVLKLSFVVVLSKTYPPFAPEAVLGAGVALQPEEHVIVAPEIGGFPEALLMTVPETDVALPSVNVICACDPASWAVR